MKIVLTREDVDYILKEYILQRGRNSIRREYE